MNTDKSLVVKKVMKYELDKINRVKRYPLSEFMRKKDVIFTLLDTEVPEELIYKATDLHEKQVKRLIELYDRYLKDVYIHSQSGSLARSIKDPDVKKEIKAEVDRRKAMAWVVRHRKTENYRKRWQREREEKERISKETEAMMSKIKPRKKKRSTFLWRKK